LDGQRPKQFVGQRAPDRRGTRIGANLAGRGRRRQGGIKGRLEKRGTARIDDERIAADVEALIKGVGPGDLSAEVVDRDCGRRIRKHRPVERVDLARAAAGRGAGNGCDVVVGLDDRGRDRQRRPDQHPAGTAIDDSQHGKSWRPIFCQRPLSTLRTPQIPGAGRSGVPKRLAGKIERAGAAGAGRDHRGPVEQVIGRRIAVGLVNGVDELASGIQRGADNAQAGKGGNRRAALVDQRQPTNCGQR
jgi:hypothetical protein